MKKLLTIIFLISAICSYGQGTQFDKAKNLRQQLTDSVTKAKADSIARVQALNKPILSINDLQAFALWLNSYNPDKGRNEVINAELSRIIGEAQKRKQNK